MKIQGKPDGTSCPPGMGLSACSSVDEDHPMLGLSRSAPEVHVIEASAGALDVESI